MLTTPFSTVIVQLTHDEEIGDLKIVETKSCQLVLQKAGQVSLPRREFKGPGPLPETRHVTGLKDLGTLKLTNRLGTNIFTVNFFYD